MEEMKAQIEQLQRQVLTLRTERRGVMLVLAALMATHQNPGDPQRLVTLYLDAHLENSEMKQRRQAPR